MTSANLTLGERLRATKLQNEDLRIKREAAALAAEGTLVSDYFQSVRTRWADDIVAGKVPEMDVLPAHVIDIIDPESYGARINDIANPCHRFNKQWQELIDWAIAEGLSIQLEFTPNDADSCDLALLVDVADTPESDE